MEKQNSNYENQSGTKAGKKDKQQNKERKRRQNIEEKANNGKRRI